MLNVPLSHHHNMIRQIAVALFVSIALIQPVDAEWDLRHASAVEDLLNDYIQTLPGGRSIQPPRLFFYQGKAYSRGCPSTGIDAPAYCPADNTVYLELKLGNYVAQEYGDFGALSIIAHEFGHAYMFERDIHPIGKDGELAADAFAGGFARFAETKGYLEPGDLDEARATFASVGDYEIHHHDHHGTPMEREKAFQDGYLQGFRLPGGSSPDPSSQSTKTTTEPTTSQPSQEPSPNSTHSNRPTTNAAPFIGLLVGLLAAFALLTVIVKLVNRAKQDDW